MHRCAFNAASHSPGSKSNCGPKQHWQCRDHRKASSNRYRNYKAISPRVLVQAVTRAASAQVSPVPTVISLQQYDDCELLWLQHGRQLSLNKQAIFWVLQDIQQGILPCDAELLRVRTAAVTALGQQQQIPGLDALRALNSCRHVLRHDPEHIRRALAQLVQLLPGVTSTQLLLDTAADLDVAPEILALQHQEADAAFLASLGTHVTPAAFHHVMRHWRQQQQQQQLDPEQLGMQEDTAAPAAAEQWQWPACLSAAWQQEQPAALAAAAAAAPAAGADQADTINPRPLLEQLTLLSEVFGSEVVHAAVSKCPQLLDAEPSSILGNLQWLQQELRVSPVTALLLAHKAGTVLLLPSSVLRARYSNLCYLLLQLLGWKLRQVHTLLCSAPQLLSVESASLAHNWQFVQGLARRRSMWLEELAAPDQALMIAVLGAGHQQLQQLRHAAEARELQGHRLVHVLKKPYVDFVFSCPGFRVWRALVPAEKQRWSLVDSGCIVTAEVHGSSKQHRQQGTVLTVDTKGKPVLIQVGSLGASDRLIGFPL